MGSNDHSTISIAAVLNTENFSKVLYLSYDGLTDPLGQSQVLPYLIGLSKNGYRFTIISFEKPKSFIFLGEQIKLQCELNKINWIPLCYHKSPPVFSTLYDIWQLWRAVKREYSTSPFNIIHCRSYVTSLVGLKTKRKWGVKFIFDMRGFWADERVEGGIWNLKNPMFKLIYSFFKKKERQFLTKADQVISLTFNAKNEIESRGFKSAPIVVIPTCVDLDLFDPAQVNKADQALLRDKLGISVIDYVLLYLGSWGTWYLKEEMLAFFVELKQRKPAAKFLIVTGDEVDIGGYQYKNDVIITRATRNQVPLHISLSHASVCFIKPTFSKKASSATKFGEILAMKIPIVVNSGWGDVQDLCDEELILVDFSKEEIEKVINHILKGKIEAKVTTLQYLSISNGIDLYHQCYLLLGKDNDPTIY